MYGLEGNLLVEWCRSLSEARGSSDLSSITGGFIQHLDEVTLLSAAKFIRNCISIDRSGDFFNGT